MGHLQLFGPLTVGLGTIMEPHGVLFSLLTEDQGLVEVDVSSILDPFNSNQFMLCPLAMSFNEKLYLAPFPPVSKLFICIIVIQ